MTAGWVDFLTTKVPSFASCFNICSALCRDMSNWNQLWITIYELQRNKALMNHRYSHLLQKPINFEKKRALLEISRLLSLKPCSLLILKNCFWKTWSEQTYFSFSKCIAMTHSTGALHQYLKVFNTIWKKNVSIFAKSAMQWKLMPRVTIGNTKDTKRKHPSFSSRVSGKYLSFSQANSKIRAFYW